MLSQKLILAWLFRASGLAIGVPALAVLVQLGIATFTGPETPPVDPLPADMRGYGLIGLLMHGAHGMASLFYVFAEAMKVAAVALAMLSCVALACGTLLFVIGNGINSGAAWARVTALIVTIVCALFWLSLTPGSQGNLFIVAMGSSAISLWAVWVLWRHFY